MPLILSVTTYRGQPPALPLTKTFRGHGGTIGRESGTDWVLRDPAVSRLHATIECHDGEYYVVDNSTNGVFINDTTRKLGEGNKHKLTDGDRMTIGDYVIRVTVTPDERGADDDERTELAPHAPLKPEESNGKVRKPTWFSQLSVADGEVDQQPISEEGTESVSDDVSIVEERAPPAETRPEDSPDPIPPNDSPVNPDDEEIAHPEPTAESGAAIENLRTLLAGAGVSDLAVGTESVPELLRTSGQILREALQGIMDVLRTRDNIKAGFYVPRTHIESADNNPLKFSPSVEELLARLLTPRFAGYMAPLPAIRQAFQDINAHQVAMMAGMRGAMSAVLDAFEPAKVQERLQKRSLVDEVLPIHRKAKTWDLFTKLYEEIAHEAKDDFDRLFVEHFARAYSEQLAKLRSGGVGEGGGSG